MPDVVVDLSLQNDRRCFFPDFPPNFVGIRVL